MTQEQLNYPSVVVNVLQQHQEDLNVNVFRTLTNLVADGLPEVYTVAVTMPGLVSVDVQPDVLNFTSPGQKQSYFMRVYSLVPVRRCYETSMHEIFFNNTINIFK